MPPTCSRSVVKTLVTRRIEVRVGYDPQTPNATMMGQLALTLLYLGYIDQARSKTERSDVQGELLRLPKCFCVQIGLRRSPAHLGDNATQRSF